MELMTADELVRVDDLPRLTREQVEEGAARIDCPHRRGDPGARLASCDLLKRLTGNGVTVCRYTCAGCRHEGGFDPAVNRHLAQTALMVVRSRYLPDGSREHAAAEADGERETAIRLVALLRGKEAAQRFVNSLVVTHVFGRAEAAVELLKQLGC